MTTSDLEKELRKRKIRKDYYCLEGGLPNEAYTIGFNKDKWEVYYSERGNKNCLQIFENEHAACEFFLKDMLRDTSIYE